MVEAPQVAKPSPARLEPAPVEESKLDAPFTLLLGSEQLKQKGKEKLLQGDVISRIPHWDYVAVDELHLRHLPQVLSQAFGDRGIPIARSHIVITDYLFMVLRMQPSVSGGVLRH